MIRTSVALLPLMFVAAPALAQSHADQHTGHAVAAQAPPASLPTGCVRRGVPDADAARTGTPGAPVCPAGAIPARLPASAPDPHAGHDMAGMRMVPTPATAPADPHAGHDMSAMGQVSPAPDPHTGHDMAGMVTRPGVQTRANTPGRLREATPPALASSEPAYAADLLFHPAEMAAAREQLRIENGDIRTTAFVIDRLEASFAEGAEGYAWDAEGWSGGDIHRFWWKSEGEGTFGDGIDDVEVQALYSRAVRPFWDVQAGLRQTYRPEGDRTDLVVGVQGLAPYWFEVDTAVFLSNRGELTARAEVEYDQRITNRWTLQPRAEINFSAETIPELSIGSGLTSLQLGARLRYEIRKEFAPYVGVEWTRSFGDTANFLEAEGRSAQDTRLVVGLRAWF